MSARARESTARNRGPCRALLALLLLGAGAAPAAPPIAAPARLREAGELVYCSDLTTPPLGYLDERGVPAGLDVELGEQLARRLGLAVRWKNIPFKGIIAALLAGECDAVLSQLFIKPERLEVLDFIPYMNSSQSLLVRSGSGAGVSGPADLAGRVIAVQTGTTIQGALEQHNRELAAAGKPALRIALFPRDTDALQQLRIGQADAYGTTLQTAAHYMAQAPGVFELAGAPFNEVPTGIGLRKGDAELLGALQAALAELRADGSYRELFAHWGLEKAALP